MVRTDSKLPRNFSPPQRPHQRAYTRFPRRQRALGVCCPTPDSYVSSTNQANQASFVLRLHHHTVGLQTLARLGQKGLSLNEETRHGSGSNE